MINDDVLRSFCCIFPPTQKEAEKEEQLWDYEEYVQSGIIRNKNGLVADVKDWTGPEVMMMKKNFLNLMLDWTCS